MIYKSIRTIGTALICLCLVPSLFGQKHYSELKYPDLGRVSRPDYTAVTLDNGLQIILMEDHELPFIQMEARLFTGGYWADPDDKVGLAELAGEVMRTGGSITMSGDDIDEALERIAASIEIGIGDLEGNASLSTLKDHFDQVFGIFTGILMNPAFPEDKIELARIQAKSAISRRNDDAPAIADREFTKLIYANSNLSREPEYATIDAITRDDMMAFHKKWIRPNGTVLGVFGDFNTKDMIKKLKQNLGTWQPREVTVDKRIDIPYEYRYAVHLVEKSDVNQSNIYIGHIGGTKDIDEYAALLMMNEIFGGGFSSRLFSRYRSDLGLAYAVMGRYGTGWHSPGIFFAHARTRSERTMEGIQALLGEIRRLTEEPVSDAELTQAREGWLNSYVFNFDSPEKTGRRLVNLTYYNYPLDFLQQTRAAVEKVTPGDILEAARKYLKPDKLHILVVGKSADFETPLSTLGDVELIDITIPEPGEAVAEATGDDLEAGRKWLDRMAGAMGGMDKISDIRNITVAASLTQITPMGEMVMDGSRIIAYPDRVLFVMQTPMGEVKMALSGESGWMSSPQGTMAAPAAVTKQLQDDIFHDPFTLLQNIDAHTVQLIEETVFADKPAADLLVSDGENSYHLYLDTETALPLGLKYKTVGQQGPTEITEIYQKYENVKGIQMPVKTEAYQKEELASRSECTEILINTELETGLFDMPE